MGDIENSKVEPSVIAKAETGKDTKVASGVPAPWKIPLAVVSVISFVSLVLSISLPLAFRNDDNSSSFDTVSETAAIASSESLSEASRLGVFTFMKEAELLCSKVDLLASVIGTGDLEESKKVYAISRSFYEQIETLAESFETIDCNIDCRPYSFEYGDADPDYRGFHRIESHLFRDSNTSLALPFAEQLQRDCDSLQVALANKAKETEISPVPTWEGILGLATEIAAKKISGEEEAYSGLSLLIFHENYRGILTQYLPFDEILKDKNAAVAQEVTLSIDEAMVHLQSYYSGDSKYGVWTNYKTLDSYRRKTIYDNAIRVVQALRAAVDSLNITLPVEAAEGSSDEKSEGEASSDERALEEGDTEIPVGFETEVAACVKHLQSLVAKMVTSVAALDAIIDTGDLATSRVAYEAARVEYEQIETLGVFFKDLDQDIDARPYAFELGEEDPDFKGFHKIERALFRDGNMRIAKEYSSELVNSTNQLSKLVQNKTVKFNVMGIFEGMIDLATEIASKKISGEEETFSDLSLLIFEKNWLGIAGFYEPFGARSDINGTSLGLAMEKIFSEQTTLLQQIKNTSSDVAYEGSGTPSYRVLPSSTYVKDIAYSSYHLAHLLVQVADSLDIFVSPTNEFNKKTFLPFEL